MILKKEVTKTHTEGEKGDLVGNYRQILVRTLHSCCIKYPDVAPTVVPMLTEFLGDENEQAALEVLLFIREAVLKFVSLKSVILEKLLENFRTIKNVKIHRHALWILGEYCQQPNDIHTVMNEIKDGLGELPLVDDELRKMAGAKGEETIEEDKKSNPTQRMMVTADGTYATQSAFVTKLSTVEADTRPPLRNYLMKGDFFIGSVIGSTLTKLALKFIDVTSDVVVQNKFVAEAMFVIASIIHFGKSGIPEKPITEDDLGRLAICIKVLSEQNSFMKHVFKVECRNAVTDMLEGSKQIIQYQGIFSKSHLLRTIYYYQYFIFFEIVTG